MRQRKNKNNKMVFQRQSQEQLRYKKHIYQMIIIIVVALAFLVTFLPGWLLVWQSEEKVNMVNAAPVEYYSPANLAVARSASANLGIYQKIQLITGKWKSNPAQADSYERKMEDFKAAELAKEQLEILYQKELYPVSLISDYGNWYSFEAKFHKVVDATFHTYAAYYWDILFEKYDGSEWHHVYMLEDGTIFLAEAWKEDGINSSTISKASDMEMDSAWKEKKVVKQKVSEIRKSLTEYFTFTDIETVDLKWMDLTQLRVGEQEYHVLQANSLNRYLYSLQPVN